MCVKNHISPQVMVWAWKETSLRYTWLGCRRPGTANHLPTFDQSLQACSLSECMLSHWMYEEYWGTCLQTRFIFRVRIWSICTVLDRWWQITLFACPPIFRSWNWHFNWLVSKALVYHDSPYVWSFSLFSCVLRLQLFLLLIMETSLVTELSWDLGSASLESVVDMCAGCVCRSLGFVNVCLHIIVLRFSCYLPVLYRLECSAHPLSACKGCHQCFWWV